MTTARSRSRPRTRPAQPYAYNLSYRAVLPAGVSFAGGSTSPAEAGAPTVVADDGVTTVTAVHANQTVYTAAVTMELLCVV